MFIFYRMDFANQDAQDSSIASVILPQEKQTMATMSSVHLSGTSI